VKPGGRRGPTGLPPFTRKLTEVELEAAASLMVQLQVLPGCNGGRPTPTTGPTGLDQAPQQLMARREWWGWAGTSLPHGGLKLSVREEPPWGGKCIQDFSVFGCVSRLNLSRNLSKTGILDGAAPAAPPSPLHCLAIPDGNRAAAVRAELPRFNHQACNTKQWVRVCASPSWLHRPRQLDTFLWLACCHKGTVPGWCGVTPPHFHAFLPLLTLHGL